MNPYKPQTRRQTTCCGARTLTAASIALEADHHDHFKVVDRWSQVFLADREKKILMVVIPLQVMAEVAIIVLDEDTPAARNWFTWMNILHLVRATNLQKLHTNLHYSGAHNWFMWMNMLHLVRRPRGMGVQIFARCATRNWCTWRVLALAPCCGSGRPAEQQAKPSMHQAIASAVSKQQHCPPVHLHMAACSEAHKSRKRVLHTNCVLNLPQLASLACAGGHHLLLRNPVPHCVVHQAPAGGEPDGRQGGALAAQAHTLPPVLRHGRLLHLLHPHCGACCAGVARSPGQRHSFAPAVTISCCLTGCCAVQPDPGVVRVADLHGSSVRQFTWLAGPCHALHM